ncbi:Unknown protein sequence [Pseudomonas syringae pv. maculicola]|nr:Unknown protein sequence [Pseudomonas syringae pv. maculicola]
MEQRKPTGKELQGQGDEHDDWNEEFHAGAGREVPEAV